MSNVALSAASIALWTYNVETGLFKRHDTGASNEDAKKFEHGGYRAFIEGGYVMPESIDDFVALHQAVKRGEVSASALIHYNPDKTPMEWQKVTYSTVFGVDGRPMLGIATGEDMTEFVRIRKSYQAEMRYLDDAQNDNLLVKSRINLTRNLVESYEAEDGVGVSAPGMNFQESVDALVAAAYSDTQKEEILKTLGSASAFEGYNEGGVWFKLEYQRRRFDESVFWVSTVAKGHRDPDSGDAMLFLYTYDIDAEKTMRIIVDRIIDIDYELLGLISVGAKILHCVCSSPFEQDMHCGADVRYPEGMLEFVDRYVADEASEARVALGFDTIVRHLEGEKTYSCSFTLQRNGERSRKKWQFAYLDESRSSIVLVRSDISQLFERQERQREALRDALAMAQRANLAKSDFLSRMSHEIRTPMNVIIGMSSLAAQRIDDPAQISNYLSKIDVSARFLLSLINDILDMSAIESGKVDVKKGKFSLEDFLGGVNAIGYEMASGKGVDYDCILPLMETFYVGDSMKLQQILVNLISNAVKFTPEGGKVRLCVDQTWSNRKKAHLRFAVSDTGIGIKEEFVPKLFDAFEQEHVENTSPYGGTGFGLAIAKNLALMMGGTLTVSSVEGDGSEFALDLTIDRWDSRGEANEIAERDADLDGISILVVDDEVALCERAESMLAEMGASVEWVDSGLGAVELVDERSEGDEGFDIILVDWKMPEMDGIETTRLIRKRVGPDVAIIITAYDWTEIEEEAKEAGANLFVPKPLFGSSLRAVLNEVLDPMERRKEPPLPDGQDFAGRRVLLVEDHELNVEVVSYIMESRGIAVDVAENGLDAIERFAQVPPGYYDAILMDIRMPVMDGLTAARSIRQMRKESADTVPIIALSANAFEKDVEESLSAGMDAHLGKPIEPAALYSTLSEFFDREKK